MSKKGVEKQVDEQLAKKNKSFKDFFDSLVVAFVIAMVIRTLFFSTYKIPTGSMLETLQLGDFIIGNKFAYLTGKPKFGDVAIFEYPVEPSMNFIKRVIGVPGDKIEIKDKVVYRNGQKLDENYKRLTYARNYYADYVNGFTVPDGYYLMLGDNRDESLDGRFWGLVPEDAFLAKAFIIYFSTDPSKNFFSGIRWNRFLKLIK